MRYKIYKITNNINDKVYVGKTILSLEERFNQHIKDSVKERCEKRPLYSAMNKYGYNHFSISLIEECPVEESNQKEIYWIEHFHGYSQGYNATLGGDGTILYNYDNIAELIKNGYTTKEIMQFIGCKEDTVRTVAKLYNLIITFPIGSVRRQMMDNRKEVHQYSLKNEYIQTFESYSMAAKWLLQQGIIKNEKTLGGVRSHIAEVCNGTRKTAYKYIWKI